MLRLKTNKESLSDRIFLKKVHLLSIWLIYEPRAEGRADPLELETNPLFTWDPGSGAHEGVEEN
jgi:hypothetical protein